MTMPFFRSEAPSRVKTMTLPTDTNSDLKLDVDGDGKTENALGKVLSTLVAQSMGALDLQGSLNKGINKGEILLLADLQATDLTKATGVGLSVRLGENPDPKPCANDADMVCGLHLTGTGKFSVKAGSTAEGSLVKGSIINGRFTGGPGKLALQLVLDGNPIALNLTAALALYQRAGFIETTGPKHSCRCDLTFALELH